jgi:hypothetical protein
LICRPPVGNAMKGSGMFAGVRDLDSHEMMPTHLYTVVFGESGDRPLIASPARFE